jgi:hypothetical protein
MSRSFSCRRRPSTLTLEALEDRVALSTITVTSLADSGPGTLRAALASIPQFGFSTITFAPTLTGTITLLSALPDLLHRHYTLRGHK